MTLASWISEWKRKYFIQWFSFRYCILNLKGIPMAFYLETIATPRRFYYLTMNVNIFKSTHNQIFLQMVSATLIHWCASLATRSHDDFYVCYAIKHFHLVNLILNKHLIQLKNLMEPKTIPLHDETIFGCSAIRLHSTDYCHYCTVSIGCCN